MADSRHFSLNISRRNSEQTLCDFVVQLKMANKDT